MGEGGWKSHHLGATNAEPMNCSNKDAFEGLHLTAPRPPEIAVEAGQLPECGRHNGCRSPA